MWLYRIYARNYANKVKEVAFVTEATFSIPSSILLRGVIANNLKLIRKKEKVTQEELSFITGITRISISRYETCQQSISLENLLLIAKALKTSPSALLEGWETTM